MDPRAVRNLIFAKRTVFNPQSVRHRDFLSSIREAPLHTTPVMFALATATANGGRFLQSTPTTNPQFSTTRTSLHTVAAKKVSSRTGRRMRQEEERTAVIETVGPEKSTLVGNRTSAGDDGFVMPDLPGAEPDFWEGPQWDPLGFFVQYMWAFGVLFGLVSSGIAVATYNEGATDFKDTPAFKESVQSQDLLEEPEASNTEVFESNPTEVAPSLE